MKFNFKIQEYQTDAVESVVRIFNGQGYHTHTGYIRDLGKVEKKPQQTTLHDDDSEESGVTGFKNEALELTDEQLFNNICDTQRLNNIKQSASLVEDLAYKNNCRNLCAYSQFAFYHNISK